MSCSLLLELQSELLTPKHEVLQSVKLPKGDHNKSIIVHLYNVVDIVYKNRSHIVRLQGCNSLFI